MKGSCYRVYVAVDGIFLFKKGYNGSLTVSHYFSYNYENPIIYSIKLIKEVERILHIS